MTVQKDVTKNIYVGNSSTRTFPFTFECPAEHPEYIKVYLMQDDGTALATSDYQLDMDAKQITYPSSGTALPEGKKLVIMRELPLQQMMNLVNNGPYFAEDIETAFDECVMAMQQIAEKLNRTITMSVDVDGSAFINEVPFEAGKSFRIADDGKSIVLTEDPARVLPLAQSALEAATAQANIATAKAMAAAESESKAESYATDANASKTAAAASSTDAANSAAVAAGYKADTLLMKNAVAENATAAKSSETNAKASADKANTSKEAAQSAATTASNFASNARNSAGEAQRYESEANSHAENASASAATATAKASEATAKAIEAMDGANRAKSEADRAQSISDNIGNPVSDVTENNGTVTVTKSNGTQSTFMAFPQGENGALPIEKGGTGATDVNSALSNLGLGSVAVENVLPIGKGGTGATDVNSALSNLGLGSVAVENVLPIGKGGTGASTSYDARSNLGVDIDVLLADATLLWQNPKPTASYGSNSMELSQPYTNFKRLLFVATSSSEGLTYISAGFINVDVLTTNIESLRNNGWTYVTYMVGTSGNGLYGEVANITASNLHYSSRSGLRPQFIYGYK